MIRNLSILIVALFLSVSMTILPASADASDLQSAAANIEAAILDAMSKAGRSGQPTLGQLGGVQGGSTDSDASGGAGSEGGSGGSGGGGSGGGGGCCFLPGTLVLMADNTAKPIEAVKVGDMVLSFDSATGKNSVQKVLELEAPIRAHHYIMTFEDGSELKLTDEHPLWAMVNGKAVWASINPANTLRFDKMEATPLKVGDTVFTKNGQWTAITKLERVDGNVQTYNLKSISNTKTFFVATSGSDNWKLAHNKR